MSTGFGFYLTGVHFQY